MTVTLDASATNDSGTGTSSLTTSFTVGASSKMLLVAVTSQKNPTVNSVTWNGTAMTLVDTVQNTAAGTGRMISLWQLPNPATGTHNVVTTLSAAFAHGVDISSWNTTASSLSLGTSAKAVATTGTSASLSTGSAFPYVSYIGIRQTGGTITKGGTSTQLAATWHTEGGASNQQFASSFTTAGATASWTWTTSDNNVMIGAPLVESTVSAGWPVKVLQSGVWVAGSLRVRQVGAWVKPTNVSAYHPGTPGTTEQRLNLPWDLPAAYSTSSSPVFAHYVPWFPLSINNAATTGDPYRSATSNDYYEKTWIKPGAVEGATDHRVYGGYTRDRPLNQPAGNASTYKLDNMKTEVQRALDAKIDGFMVDMVSITPTSENWLNLTRLFDASDAVFASTGKRLWIVPIVDGSAAGIKANATSTADAVGGLLSRPAIWKPGGVFTLPIFAPESATSPLTFWTAVKNRLESTWATPTQLWFCYVATWNAANTATALNSIAYGHGRWGDRDSDTTGADTTSNRQAASTCHTTYTGKKWLHFVAPGDTRPNDTNQAGGYRTWENKGDLTFTNTWLAAIGDGTHDAADAVQMTTWNDFAENAHTCPSFNNGYVWVDLNTYYMTKFKTGSYPTIVRDGLYLFHRPHSTSLSSFTGVQTRFALSWGATAAVNIVSVVAFLTAPATVEFLVNGSVSGTQSGVAGYNRWEFALPASGVVSARATRSSVVVAGTTVTSTLTLGGSQVADDRHYRAYSSLRQYTNT